MIKPHGAEELKPLYVEDDAVRAQLLEEAAGLPAVVVSSAAASSAVMLGSGYFTPLTGFMDAADAKSVAVNMHTTDGLLWPTPVVNMIPGDQVPVGRRSPAAASPCWIRMWTAIPLLPSRK